MYENVSKYNLEDKDWLIAGDQNEMIVLIVCSNEVVLPHEVMALNYAGFAPRTALSTSQALEQIAFHEH